MNLSNKNLKSLPTNLPEEVGHFDCDNNELTDLAGAPIHARGNFYCSNNKLTSLRGAPKRVENFACALNMLIDLNGSLGYVGGFANCRNNKLKSLFGVPKTIKGSFDVRSNPDLLDISDKWGSDIEGEIQFDLNPGMAILPLIKFNWLSCNHNIVVSIHERYKGVSKQNILDFQFDLIEKGYAENAKWKPEI